MRHDHEFCPDDTICVQCEAKLPDDTEPEHVNNGFCTPLCEQVYELIAMGYRRVSNKFGMIARIDRKDWQQFLADEGYYLGANHEGNMADTYRRVYSQDKKDVPLEVSQRIPSSNHDTCGYVQIGPEEEIVFNLQGARTALLLEIEQCLAQKPTLAPAAIMRCILDPSMSWALWEIVKEEMGPDPDGLNNRVLNPDSHSGRMFTALVKCQDELSFFINDLDEGDKVDPFGGFVEAEQLASDVIAEVKSDPEQVEPSPEHP